MVATGNVVKEMSIGNTRIKICDDYCREKTKAEVEEILKQITREREVKAEDISDELVKAVNKGGAENGLCEKDQ